MTDAEIFATFAREHGLDEERVESARQKGVNMTTLVMLCGGRSAVEVNAILFPVTIDRETADELATKARTLSSFGGAHGHHYRHAA